MSDAIAHARQDENGAWHIHELNHHLQKVAGLAAGFAKEFGSEVAAS